jgi:hypothetical protein
MKKYLLGFLLTLLVLNSNALAATTVPGHSKSKQDIDNNGIPDAGVYVNGHYTSVYAYDANGDYYWDLGDGRIQSTVSNIEELDQDTLTKCDYVVNYRADFGNTSYMDEGWIQNHIKCKGYDDKGTYNYLIVSQNDPRYTGNPEWSIWGTWEYHVLTESKSGNLVRPMNHTNN